MKKLTAFLLVLVLLAGPLLNCQADDEEPLEFTSIVTHALDQTAREWCATGYSRALFAVTIYFDICLELDDNPDVDFINSPCAVGRVGNKVAAVLQGKDGWILIIYSPTDGTCSYSHGSTSMTYSEGLISSTMEAAGADSVHILEVSDILDAMSDFTSAFSNSGLLD